MILFNILQQTNFTIHSARPDSTASYTNNHHNQNYAQDHTSTSPSSIHSHPSDNAYMGYVRTQFLQRNGFGLFGGRVMRLSNGLGHRPSVRSRIHRWRQGDWRRPCKLPCGGQRNVDKCSNVRPLYLPSPKIQISNFKITPKMTQIIAISIIISDKFGRAILSDIMGVLPDEIDNGGPESFDGFLEFV